MLFCGLVSTALSASIGAPVQIVFFLLQSPVLRRVQASLPPGAEDEIIVIEHWPGRRVHLQDFFWTDAKDAPPWVDPDQGLNFYETKTITERPSGEKDGVPEVVPPPGPGPGQSPDCINCIDPTATSEEEDETIGVLIGDDPGPRYWLLTVLRAGESVPPKIELRLARLYRTAFSRQQQRHLGLLSTDPRGNRIFKRRSAALEIPNTRVQGSSSSTSETPLPLTNVRNKQLKFMESSLLTKSLRAVYNTDVLDNDYEKSEKESAVKKVSPHDNIFSMEVEKSTEETSAFDTTEPASNTSETLRNERTEDSNTAHLLTFESTENSSSLSSPSGNPELKINTATSSKLRKSLEHSAQGIVQVKMHNTTVLQDGATRLIYSVHLGGKPVPAETAARDMALLSAQEVALELGAPVVIQSEPYLKESQPLALSRKRDIWLLVGAAGAAVILLAFIFVGLIVAAKRKRAHSAVSAPPSKSILKKDNQYLPATTGRENAGFSSSESEAKSDGTSRRPTAGSQSRTPVTPVSQNSLEDGLQEIASDEDVEPRKKTARVSSPCERQEYPLRKNRIAHTRMTRTNAMEQPRTPDSIDTMDGRLDAMGSLENVIGRQEEAAASPYSYLSMPSCKQFPTMKNVEPLSRVLEPITVKHLDIESPEIPRRANDLINAERYDKPDDKYLARSMSASRDPGVVGPIVWNLRRHGITVEGNDASETESEAVPVASSGPVGRARRRLHELLEDSFSLFGSRDFRAKDFQTSRTRPDSAERLSNDFTGFAESCGRSAHASPIATPTLERKSRPLTSLPRRYAAEEIIETGQDRATNNRSAWAARPMSAGPFHKPNLPEVDTRRILVDAQLSPEDPAVPLITSIKKELEKFS